MTAVVRDRRPPLVLIRVLNPINRLLLCTPVGRLVRPFALLEFRGRKTGRSFRVPVGVHHAEGTPVVFTPAPWRANFAGGLDVVVRHRGRSRPMVGTLVADPAQVAGALNAVIDGGEPAGRMGIKAPDGYRFTPADVVAVDRQMIRLTP